jgi:hypothetical protein
MLTMTLNPDVRKRNADMLAAEQHDSEPDNAPPPAKRRQVTKSNIILDDDEEELELELGGVGGGHGDDDEHEHEGELGISLQFRFLHGFADGGDNGEQDDTLLDADDTGNGVCFFLLFQ